MPLPIERYALYGEPLREVELGFMHVEPIRSRSGRFAWTIEPHAHAELHQVMLVTAGGGTMQVEGTGVPLRVPALIVVPSRVVHGYAFAPGSDGWIATIAEELVAEAARADPAGLDAFARARWIQPLPAADADAIERILSDLDRELVWSAPAGRLAVRANLMHLLVLIVRLLGAETAHAPPPSSHLAIAEGFRRLVEEHFRRAAPVSFYARELGVSEDRLLAACRHRFGQAPIGVLHRRVLIEAQRWLAYTNRGVGVISRELGFEDPAYFSRFFRKQTGRTPRAYRASASPVGDAPRRNGPSGEGERPA